MTQKYHIVRDIALGFIGNYIPFVGYAANIYAEKNMYIDNSQLYKMSGYFGIITGFIVEIYLVPFADEPLKTIESAICCLGWGANLWPLCNIQGIHPEHNHQLELIGDHNNSLEFN